MDWQHLLDTLTNECHDRPQNLFRARKAVQSIRDGIEELGRLGYHFHLASGSQTPPKKYPKLLFHFEKAPQGFLCLCEEDREFLGEGWFDTKEAAAHAEGMGHQFRRGGVFPTRGLPTIIENDNLTPLDRRRLEGLE
ncbi:MAG TPA: hypothetical protein VJQ25_05930 [Nitrospira sp.]|nr:hypothetical protein [Nitrospira sp.]